MVGDSARMMIPDLPGLMPRFRANYRKPTGADVPVIVLITNVIGEPTGTVKNIRLQKPVSQLRILPEALVFYTAQGYF